MGEGEKVSTPMKCRSMLPIAIVMMLVAGWMITAGVMEMQPVWGPTSCPDPGVCGTYAAGCTPDQQSCFCFKTAEGSGECIDDFYCDSAGDCTDSADCASGEACIVDTCCGAPRCATKQCTGAKLQMEGQGKTASGQG